MNLAGTDAREEFAAAWRYLSNPAFHDELIAANGNVRPQWHPLVDSLLEIGPEGLARRWQEGRRLVHENGITYNVYGDPQSTDRPWPLDPIPLVIGAGEWRTIEAAMRQRATLLNAILTDLYGPQHLLREGLLPSELVFRHTGFLRPCAGLSVPKGINLHIYAADLARSPDGQWWVIADRTQAPSGAGYALENRLVASRVLPDVFARAHVRGMANFFQTYRDTLRGIVPEHRENPRIVLLTPGPYNETYFEHAFLARYLGYTLVEGGDLTVRENRVYLKTLGGLLPVDLIVRRQDDSFCDPLELRGDSMLGVPGLVEAVRAGHVAVANALGTGLLESAAPAAFLPILCRHMLGEDLKMPTIATWWCGQPRPFEFVASHLDNVVIKPTFPGRNDHPIFGARLSVKERAQLLERMRASPADFVAQEQVSLSTVPVWDDGRLEPRHFVLRVYVVAAGDSYAVMPGGLTRVTTSLDSLVVSMQRGGGSKDTWVIGDGPTPEFSLLQAPAVPLEVSRATFDLPSRVADNLFWLGRNVERIEVAVRVTRAIVSRLYSESDPASAAGRDAGVRILAALGYLSTDLPAAADRTARLQDELLEMIYDSATPTSLGSNLHQVRHLAWLLRDRISADAWRILNHFDQQFSNPAPPEPLRISGALNLLDNAIMTLSAFSGLVMESMTRGHGWRFLDIGRRLERADQMVELIRHGLGLVPTDESGRLEALLEIADSFLTYRSRYLTSMQPDLVLDLLLLDEANPRSAAFQLARLREHIEHMPESRSSIHRPAEWRLAVELLTEVQLAEVAELARLDPAGRLSNLDNLLLRLAGELRRLSEAITRSYFSHALASRQLHAR
ncbi:MAG: circularly permuted type 2 ATP-grasp protein [Candidatus Binataceae bacterium]|nr:circularly permuted type 2 ATP-grasp protein [Candidatus Binataceae bacterium]